MTDDKKRLLCLLDDVLSTYRFDAWENSDKIADHLVQHGVTFAKDKDVLNKWTPVSERLPKKGERFLCIWANGRIYDGYRSDSFYDDFIINGVSYVNVFFTHWMPRPELSEEE